MRHSVSAIAVLLAGATSLVGPAVAERAAITALRSGMAQCSGSDQVCGGVSRADVDLEGLRLWHPWREQSGLRVEAARVVITMDTQGVQIDAHELRVGRATQPAPKAPALDSPPAEPSPAPAPSRTSVFDTRGVPVHLRVHGPTTWSHAGVEVSLGDPELHLSGHGDATARFSLHTAGRGMRADGHERWTATPIEGDPRRWRATGSVRIAEGPVVPAALTLSREGIDATLRDGKGGRIGLRMPLPTRERRPTSLSVDAEQFDLAALGQLGQRTLQRWGIDSSRARLDGAFEASGLDPADAEGRAEFTHWVIDGLVVDRRKLAREPVTLDAIELDGQLSWRDEDMTGELWVAHRQARVMLAGQRDEDALDLRVELAPLPCQDLIDAFPAAMSEMVEGTRLSGMTGGLAELHMDHAALRLARADADRRPSDAAPGSMSLSFPFLEQCTVEQDDPRLDLAALSGPYRHRFVDDRGREQRRVMAPGAPGYVPLHEVPLMSRAFVTLEDRRFWSHDGFDREQMHNAFWHNVVQGRVSRGASTISQQTARNLWLGVDRSWGRKLQEALLTARLESSTSKTRIMELYLNVIELGPGVHGVDDAARFYFGRPASTLTVLQSVHLAALAPAPRRFAYEFIDGRVDPEWLDKLRSHVRRMYRAGFITRRQLLSALREDLELLDRTDA